MPLCSCRCAFAVVFTLLRYHRCALITALLPVQSRRRFLAASLSPLFTHRYVFIATPLPLGSRRCALDAVSSMLRPCRCNFATRLLLLRPAFLMLRSRRYAFSAVFCRYALAAKFSLLCFTLSPQHSQPCAVAAALSLLRFFCCALAALLSLARYHRCTLARFRRFSLFSVAKISRGRLNVALSRDPAAVLTPLHTYCCALSALLLPQFSSR